MFSTPVGLTSVRIIGFYLRREDRAMARHRIG